MEGFFDSLKTYTEQSDWSDQRRAMHWIGRLSTLFCNELFFTSLLLGKSLSISLLTNAYFSLSFCTIFNNHIKTNTKNFVWFLDFGEIADSDRDIHVSLSDQ